MRRFVFREIPNKKCNDFNDEPQTIKVKYFIVRESKDKQSWLVERAGWQGKKQRHYIKKSECSEV